MIKLKLLDRLEKQWDGCERCDLARSRAHLVHWRGNPDAPLFVIGEAPGADEDAQGRPFVGQAGRMLDLILKQAGLGTEHVFIGNMVACRPPGNRTPERDELKACAPRLQIMLRIVRPRTLLLLGGSAAKLAGVQTVTAHRGSEQAVDILCYDKEVRSWPALVTFHPSYVLRTGGQSGEAFGQVVGDVVAAWKLATSVDLGPI